MKKTITSAALLTILCAGMGASSVAMAGHTNELLEADLDGREEVGEDPSKRLVGDPDGKGKGYVFGVDGDPTTLCYNVIVNKIQLVPVGEGMMAHIHEGARDTNGPVVAALAGPEDTNAADCLTEGEMGKFPTGEAGIVQRILQNPEDFYINVHNPEFPAGAIRGQLKNTIHDHAAVPKPSGGAPTTPMNVTGMVYSGTAVEIFWERSTDSDGSVVAYSVLRDGVAVGSVQGNSFFDDSLTSDTAYSYAIKAIDNMANESMASAATVVQTAK